MDYWSSSESKGFKLITALPHPGHESAVSVTPLYSIDMMGVLTCKISVNGYPVSYAVATGSAVSLIRDGFAIYHDIQFSHVSGPCITVVTGECLDCSKLVCLL